MTGGLDSLSEAFLKCPDPYLTPFLGGQRQDSARDPPADHPHQDSTEHEGFLRYQYYTPGKGPFSPWIVSLSLLTAKGFLSSSLLD